MVDGKWLVALPLLLFASTAHCGQSLAEHIRDDPACRQYNDGCSICLIKDGKAECSTPTIACTITGWVCVDQGGADAAKSGQGSADETKQAP